MNGLTRYLCSSVALLVLLVSSSAWAQDIDARAGAEHPAHDLMFSVAPHVGLLVPQLFSDLGSWPVFGLELGFIAPFDVGSMIRPLQINLDVMYAQPGATGTSTEANLGEEGAAYDWQLTQRMLVLEAAGLWRFMPPGEGLSVYGTIGPRLYLMQTVLEATGNGGEDFGRNEETKTQVGLMVGGGVEYALGPGSLFGGLEFGWSDLNERITGDSNTGAFVIDLGYRFMF